MRKNIKFSLLTTFIIAGFLSLLFSQADTLERGRDLYKKGNYTEAVRVLESYARSVEGNLSQAKSYAEANYLIAKIYYEAGEARQVETYLTKALKADRSIGGDEAIEAFKSRVDKLRAIMPNTAPKVGDVKDITVNGVSYEMVAIPGRNYSIGKYEVTQGFWQAVMGSNPSKFKKGDNYPVEEISWNDCQVFIQKLNDKTGKRFRLPSEAEWEYVCRAGTTRGPYGDIYAIAWYEGNSDKSTHPVGQKQPNAFGLYDMLGNVWEWCQDLYVDGGSYRVCRGGSWNDDNWDVRASGRFADGPRRRHNAIGLRLASDSVGG